MLILKPNKRSDSRKRLENISLTTKLIRYVSKKNWNFCRSALLFLGFYSNEVHWPFRSRKFLGSMTQLWLIFAAYSHHLGICKFAVLSIRFIANNTLHFLWHSPFRLANIFLIETWSDCQIRNTIWVMEKFDKLCKNLQGIPALLQLKSLTESPGTCCGLSGTNRCEHRLPEEYICYSAQTNHVACPDLAICGCGAGWRAVNCHLLTSSLHLHLFWRCDLMFTHRGAIKPKPKSKKKSKEKKSQRPLVISASTSKLI